LKHIKMLLCLCKYTKGIRKYYFGIGIFLLVQNVQSLSTPFFISQIIDKSIANKDIKSLIFYSSIIICLNIVSGFTMVFSQKISTKLERKITIKLRKECLNKVIKQSGDFYTNSSSSDILTLFMQDIENISGILSTHILTIIHNCITIIGVLFFLIWLHKSMSIIVFVFTVILVLIQKKSNMEMEKASMNSRESVIQLQGTFQEFIYNMLSFAQNGLIRFQKGKLDKDETNFTIAKLNTVGTMTTYNALMNILTGLLAISIIGWGGYNVIIGAMTIGKLFSFEVYSQRLISPVMSLSNISVELSSAYISWDRIKKLLYSKSIVEDNGIIEKNIEGNILFKGLDFGYKKERVLSNLELYIDKGSTHAIVGPSGSGKTTITQLLFRLWKSDKGIIKIDNHNIEEYKLDNLRNQISIVSQNIFLLNDTIYNNIVLGKKNVSNEEVETVLKQADIYELVSNLPNGWNTIIGENGIRLSGGEKQRLSIARAIFKNAPILIFDEATSMLDNETENNIIQQVLLLFKNKTIVLIAHRLSTVKNADVISVLKEGRIIEEGTHEILMKLKGFYYDLYTT